MSGPVAEWGGKTEPLRERLAHRYYRLRWVGDDWSTLRPPHKEAYYELADELIAEIADAGYRLVEADAWEAWMETRDE